MIKNNIIEYSNIHVNHSIYYDDDLKIGKKMELCKNLGINIFKLNYPEPINEFMKDETLLIMLGHCENPIFFEMPSFKELLDYLIEMKVEDNLLVKCKMPKIDADLYHLILISTFFEKTKNIIHVFDNDNNLYFLFENINKQKFEKYINYNGKYDSINFEERNFVKDTLSLIKNLYNEKNKIKINIDGLNPYEIYEVVIQCGDKLIEKVNLKSLDYILSYINIDNYKLIAKLYSISYPKGVRAFEFILKELKNRYNHILCDKNNIHLTIVELLSKCKINKWNDTNDLIRACSNNKTLIFKGNEEKILEESDFIKISKDNLNYINKKYGDYCLDVLCENMPYPFDRIGWKDDIKQFLSFDLTECRFIDFEHSLIGFLLENKFCKPNGNNFDKARYYFFKNYKYDDINYNRLLNYFSEHLSLDISNINNISISKKWNLKLKKKVIKYIIDNNLDLNKENVKNIIFRFLNPPITNLLFTVHSLNLLVNENSNIFEPFVNLGEIFISSIVLKCNSYLGLTKDMNKIYAMNEIWEEISNKSENHIVLEGELPNYNIKKNFNVCFFTEPYDNLETFEYHFNILFKSIRICWDLLTDNGIFIINSKNPVYIIAYITKRFDNTFLGTLSNENTNVNPLWIFCKGNNKVDLKQIKLKNFFKKDYIEAFKKDLDK